jgi:hypothetical protein
MESNNRESEYLSPVLDSALILKIYGIEGE